MYSSLQLALKKAKIISKTRKTKKNKNSTRDSSSSLTQKPYMVVPYYKGVSESLKRICGKHGVQVYFKGGYTIKTLLMNPKDQDPILKKVGSSIDISVAWLTAMKNTLVNPQDHLGRGLKNIKRPPHQYMTIATSLVIKSPLKISIL